MRGIVDGARRRRESSPGLRPGLAGALLMALASSAAGQTFVPTVIPDPDPAIEQADLIVAEGFEISLFAADPAIAKPIQMNFDSQGRLWAASSETYPHILPGEKPHDRVVVLEDADRDGRAERTTVFANGLLIPTGIEPGDGGAYVANSTELIHLADTDGDGRADRRRVVLSGFGTEDTHHILHTLRWGPDGMLYFNQSIYIHSHIETPYGVKTLNGGGVWSFRPETFQLDVFIRGLVNPWGHAFDRWGQSFGTDGAGGEGINYLLPGASYYTAPDATRILAGLNPGSPKHCGLEMVDGRHLPDDWQGNLVTNDFRANRVCRFALSDDGAGYASRQLPELVKSSNVAFRPVDVKQGPDGAIYIADWYNPIIQHGEVDFRDPRRDHVHGRIWRVAAKGRPASPRVEFASAPTSELLAALKAPESFTRHHAKRELKRRGASVLPELEAWVAQQRDEQVLLEGLWAFQSLDRVESTLLRRLLRAEDPRVRAAATRVLRYWYVLIPTARDLLAVQVVDDNPRVRLEAVRALASIRTTRSLELALSVLEKPMDRFLDYALWVTARELAPAWLPEFEAGRWQMADRPAQFEFALTAVASPAVVRPLVGLIRDGSVPPDRMPGVLELVSSLGTPDELRPLFDRALETATNGDAKGTLPLLSALLKAATTRQAVPSGNLNDVAVLLEAPDQHVRADAARLIGAWKLESLRLQLAELATGQDTAAPLREAAIAGLVTLGGDASRDLLASLAESGELDVQTMAVVGLAELDPAHAAAAAVKLLGADNANDSVPLLTVFLRRDDGPALLTAALAGKQINPDLAKLAQRAARTAGRDLSELVAALGAAGGLGAGPVELTPQALAALVAEVKEHGDPARGEAVYRRQDVSCLKCHSIAGAGGRVGPDLLSIGASAQIDYLVESILSPNKAVKENYHSLVATTDEGLIYAGILVRQTDNELVIRDAEDREIAIAKSSIEEQAPGGSIMPAGLVDNLTRGELVDLVRFLSELGKEGPYAVGRARVARRWQALEKTKEIEVLLEDTSFATAAGDDPRLAWRGVYSTVAGQVPLSELPVLQTREEAPPTAFVRVELDVTTAGAVRISLGDVAGLEGWLDGQPQALAPTMDTDLSTGKHVLTIVVNMNTRRAPLSCELLDVPGSPAQVQWVGGK